MTLRDLIDVHKGEMGWIIGKGPGLHTARARNWEGIGPLRFCINEATLHVPNPTYAVIRDDVPVREVMKALPAGCTAAIGHTRFSLGEGTRVVEFNVEPTLEHLTMTPQQLAERNQLYGCGGTALFAAHLAWLTGVRHMIFVGCEGRGGYAKFLDKQAGHDDQWMAIRERTRIMLCVLSAHQGLLTWEDYK